MLSQTLLSLFWILSQTFFVVHCTILEKQSLFLVLLRCVYVQKLLKGSQRENTLSDKTEALKYE